MDKINLEQVLAGLHPGLVLNDLAPEDVQFIKGLLAKQDVLEKGPQDG